MRGGHERYAPRGVLDRDPYWASGDAVRAATLEFEFARALRCDQVRFEESLALGQRARRFELEARVAGEWRPRAS